MATRSVCLFCLKVTTRPTTTRAPTKLTTVHPLPFIASRSFHASSWKSAETPTPPSKAANMAEDLSIKGVPAKKHGLIERLTTGIREFMPSTTDQYVAYGVTQELYNECVSQAAYVEGAELSDSAKFWYEVCKREPTFAAWAQVTVLHIWMLVVRIRAFEPERVQTWQQHLVDHFFYDSEGKMIHTFKLTSGGQRKKYLQDLYEQYRGMVAGFDEGLCKGDAVLAAAIWRNVFDAKKDVDVELLAIVTSYVRRVISGLDKVSDETVYTGRIQFGRPLDEESYVMHKSKFLERVMKEQEEDPRKTEKNVDGAKIDDRLKVAA